MSSRDASSTESGSRAEALFLDYVEHGGADFEELCGRHPELEDQLRGLWRDWNWIDELRAGAATPETGGPGQRYEIRREIGRGGMGVVFEVWDRELRRRLAVKVSRARHGGRGHYRFLEEAQVTAQLDHPGVVPIHELGIDSEGQAYFSMRRVEGQTLGEVFERAHRGEREWSRTRALGILVQVCETLAFAHSKGVVHRDLKPSNVMVGRFGQVYVMDWGLAKVLAPDAGVPHPRRADGPAPWQVTSIRSEPADETPGSPFATIEGSVLGTPAYMPPEQASGRTEELGAPGDVYAVGAILYHLLTGEQPYSDAGATQPEILAAVRSGPPRPADRAGRDVPPELVAICEKAMDRDPADRYASMEALAADLRAFLENRVVRAHQTGPLVETRKWIARNRALAAALGTSVAVLAAALVLQLQKVAQLERANAEAAFENYVANVSMAAHKLDLSDVPGARRHLEACPPELRNWEWVLQWERCDESSQVLPGAGFHQAAFHPTEPLLAGVTWSGLVWVFDLGANANVARLDAGCTHVMGVDFTADGRWLLSACTSIRAWDTGTWELAREYVNDAEARDLNFEPGGGARFATAHLDGTIRVWALDSTTATAVFPVHDGAAWSVAWSPDGSLLASSSSDGTIAVTDVETGAVVQRLRARQTDADWNGSWEVAFGPGGKRLVSGQPDGALTVWDAGTGELLEVLRGHTAQVTQVEFLDEGRLISVSHDRSGGLWDLEGRRRARQLLGHERVLNGLAVAPDGDLLATCSADGTLRTWDLREAAGPPLVLSTPDGTYHARLSADGARVAAGGQDVKVWDARSGELLHRLPTGTSVAAFSADGSELYVTRRGESEVLVFDTSSGEERPAFRDEAAPPQWTLAVDPRGRWLASGTDERVTLWDVETRRMAAVRPGRFLPALHPSRDLIALGTAEGEVVLAACPELTVMHTLAAGMSTVWELAFGPDGELLAAAGDAGLVRIWSSRTGEHLRDIEVHPRNNVFSLDFSPDGTRLVTGSDDKAVKLWDLATGQEVLTLTGSRSMVDQVRFSADGRTLLASAHDSKVRLWRTTADAAQVGAAEQLAASALSRAATVGRAFEELLSDPSHPEPLRAAALRLIARSGPRHAASNEAHRELFSEPGRARSEYALAVERQRHVCAANPLSAHYLNTLGIGLMRIGEYRQALEALERAQSRNPSAVDRAYMVICLHELGERERALALLEELRAAAGAPGFPAEALAEAEAWVSGKER